ncbi:MAG: hypothetical protein ACI4VX_00305 [Succinivibrionaceae bacterium]
MVGVSVLMLRFLPFIYIAVFKAKVVFADGNSSLADLQKTLRKNNY